MAVMEMHHWEFDFSMASFVCTDLELIDGGKSNDRCYGCGMTVPLDSLVRYFGGEKIGALLSATLNFLASKEGLSWREHQR